MRERTVCPVQDHGRERLVVVAGQAKPYFLQTQTVQQWCIRLFGVECLSGLA
jgi:hypothetical protein